MSNDPEKVTEIKYVHGYASLAQFIASDPGHSTSIYRRFDYLAARDLLFQQSELVELEAELRAFDQEDLRHAQDDDDSVRDIELFKKRAAADAQSKEAYRLQLHERIREKLKQYRKWTF